MRFYTYCREHLFCGAWIDWTRAWWNSPFMLKWGRLIMLFSLGLAAGTIINSTRVSLDFFLVCMLIFCWVLGLAISVSTTRVYSARGLGLFGTVSGDILLYTGILCGIIIADDKNANWIPDVPVPSQDVVLNYARGLLLIAAPIFAFGLVMSLVNDRRRKNAICGDDERCRRSWRQIRHLYDVPDDRPEGGV